MSGPQATAPRPSGGERAAPQQVLLVDDEAGIRHLAGRILREDGFVVQEAGDGHEALDFITRGEVLLDAVVSDIVMPRVNGVELLQILSLSHPSLPIVLMSGYGLDDLARRDIAAPCAILAKPFTPDRLITEVRRCIAERR